MLTNSFAVRAASDSIDFEKERAALAKLDKHAFKKWGKLEALQADPVWLEEQADSEIYGTVFHKGWFNPKVQRQIVPDKEDGLLVIDTIILGPKIISQVVTLSANLALSYFFPYVQGGPIHSKTFSNIRHVKTFEEGLKLPHFLLQETPLTHAEFSSELDAGEILTTKTTNGFFARFSLDILDLIGVSSLIPVQLGPKAKLHFQKTLKVSIAKKTEDLAVLLIENTKEKGVGIGIGFGFTFDDIIDIPVSIGINGASGYTPFKANLKTSTQNIDSIAYEVDLSDPEGLAAYHSFLQSDFTVLQDLAELEDSPVKMEVRKVGKATITERNFGLDLLAWRIGRRHITMSALYETTLPGGRFYKYQEAMSKKVKDSGGIGGKEQTSLKFSVIVPLSSSEGLDESKSFTLNSEYTYHDYRAKGKELDKISDTISNFGLPLGIPVNFSPKENYDEVLVYANVQFSAVAMTKIISSDSQDVWIAVASATGLADPLNWEDKSARTLYSVTNKKNPKNLRRLSIARKVVEKLHLLRSPDLPLALKAKTLLRQLQKKRIGHLLHKTMVNIVGWDILMGQGHIKGNL